MLIYEFRDKKLMNGSLTTECGMLRAVGESSRARAEIKRSLSNEKTQSLTEVESFRTTARKWSKM